MDFPLPVLQGVVWKVYEDDLTNDVEGAAGTRGANETITEKIFVTLPGNCNQEKQLVSPSTT